MDLHEEPEPQLRERQKKQRRTETDENNVKSPKTGACPVKGTNALQKAPLSPETQSEASCSYFLRPRKENPQKMKRVDRLHEESELMEKPKKRGRAETAKERAKSQKTGAHLVKRNYLKKARSSSSVTPPEPSCSPEFTTVRDQLYERPEPWADDLPEVFSEHYSIGKHLGRGCYAHVYAGVRKSDGRKVAIKYLLKDMGDYFTPPGQTRSLPREVVATELVSKRTCPYVIKLLEWFETPNGFLLVLERPRKCITLYQFCIRVQDRMSEDMARIIMWKVVKAAIHCQNNGVIHRDMKPNNILVNPETLELKLIDFGLVHIIWDIIYKGFGGPGFFLPITWIYTPHYQSCSPLCDVVHTLGTLLYCLTCGREAKDNLPSPFAINGLSETCCNLINQCMNIDENQRPWFEEILRHEWFQGMKIPTKRRRRRRA